MAYSVDRADYPGKHVVALLDAEGDEPATGFAVGTLIHHQDIVTTSFAHVKNTIAIPDTAAAITVKKDNHGSPVKQVCPAVFEAGKLGACHGVAAHKGKAILLRQREAAAADFLLDTAAVNDQCGFGNQGGVVF